MARLPGSTFQLPTQGLFYTSGELDPTVTNGEVHVYPLTAIDEIELKTPDLLFTGKAIENVFKRCIPSILKPMELTTIDVDYLLVCLRLVSYGPEIEMKFKHTCENAHEHNYTGSVEYFVTQTRTMSLKDYENEYTVKHSSGMEIGIIPMKYSDFVKYMTEINDMVSDVENYKQPAPEELLDKEAKRLAQNISHVTNKRDVNVTDKSHIAEWIKTLSVSQVKEITDKFASQTEWGCDTKIRTTCKDCQKEVEIPVSINPIDFFTWS